MSTEAFDNFVKRRLNEAKNNNLSVNTDWDKRREDWIRSLNNLYSRMEQYLEKYLKADQIQVTREEIEISEEFLGSYVVEKLTFQIGNEKVVAQPIGRNVIGASGRVDLIGVRGRVRLVLLEKADPANQTKNKVAEIMGKELIRPMVPCSDTIETVWHIATFPPHITTTPLDADTFRDAFVELSDV